MPKVGRQVKESMVQELTSALKERPVFFVASVGPLQAGDADTLRKRLSGVQARLLMMKRTLGLQGIRALKLDQTEGLFDGSVTLVLPGEDIIPAAKLLFDFAKEAQDKLTVRGGFIDGELFDQQRLKELADLPSKPVLIAQLIGVIESPISDVIMTLEAAISELAWVIEEASKKKPAADPAGSGTEAPAVVSEAAPATPAAPAAAPAAEPAAEAKAEPTEPSAPPAS